LGKSSEVLSMKKKPYKTQEIESKLKKENNIIVQDKKYQPTWESIDSRPLPSWYDEAKFGIFIHWGVFSVPSFVSEWFWWYWKGLERPDVVEFMKNNYPPNFSYADFASQFTAEFFDADQWAQIFKDSGAQYVVLTSKHHEGFTNWPSANSWNWNSMDVGPHRDLVGELRDSIRKNTNIKFGLYHSLFEWFNPLFNEDKANGFNTTSYVTTKTMPELYDLVTKYEPDVLWSDGDVAPVEYWNSTGFLAWLYNESPVKDVVVTNDRWGTGTACKHGGYYTCQDRYNPGKLVNHKWENCMTIDKKSWGYRRNAKLEDYLTIEELIEVLATTISCGGNLLMNVGPTKEGTIPAVFQQKLQQMGLWLAVNGEAVYGSVPWKISQHDSNNTDVWYTAGKDNSTVHAFVLKWPESNQLLLGDVSQSVGSATKVTMLGTDEEIEWTNQDGLVRINMPPINPGQLKWAWVFKFTEMKF